MKKLWQCLVFAGTLSLVLLGVTTSSFAASSDAAEVQKMVTLFQKGSVRQSMNVAKRLLASPKRLKSRSLRGRVYFYLGLMFFNKKQKVLARKSFSKAFAHDPRLRLQIGSPPALRRFVNKVRADWKTQESFSSPMLPKQEPPPPPINTNQLLAWVSAGVALVGLTAGLIAGNNALTTSGQASSLLRTSHENKWNEPLMTPHITSLNQQAVSQSLIANICYGVAGVATASSVTFFVLSGMSGGSSATAKAPATRSILPAMAGVPTTPVAASSKGGVR